jgi:GAF domain-containing protein
MNTAHATAWGAETIPEDTRATESSDRSGQDPLDILLEHLKSHPRVDAAAFMLVEPGGARVETAAGWFHSPLLREALGAALEWPLDRDLPGLVEAALERGRPLFLPRVEDWQAAASLRTRVERSSDPIVAARAWEALRHASVIGCPVRSEFSGPVGVLVVASLDPERALERPDLETVAVLADLAALARERSELLSAETARAREELLLKRAAEDTAGSLELPDVEQRAADHALRLVNADHARLTRVAPYAWRLELSASAGVDIARQEAAFDPGILAQVARDREPLRVDEPVPYVHIPIGMGGRLFGLLSVVRHHGPPFEAHDVEVLETLARITAAAMANAHDFERERRVARALTAGFVPSSPLAIRDYEVGLLYEPAQDQPAGGDVFGTWKLPNGEVAVVLGDVAGKGVETAALSAMARFFIEAATWECSSPGEVLRRANRMLGARLPEDTFVTAVLGFFKDNRIRYANAGHLPAVLVRAAGDVEEVSGRGLALGVVEDTSYDEHELQLNPGDLLVGFTDGLIEARRSGEVFGMERLVAAVAAAARRPESVNSMLRDVHREVRGWAGGLSDDVAALALKRQPNQ